MTRAIAEADWKVLRRVHPLALDRYCERVLAEIERVTHNKAQSTRAAHVLSISLVGANSGAK